MKPLPSVIARYWRHGGLVLLSALVIAMTWRQGMLFEMHKKHFSSRYAHKCIPIAISDLTYGHQRDYIGFYRVGEVFFQDHESSLNALIRKALTLTDPQGPPLLFCSDLGLVDYTRSAFQLFGYRSESIYYLFFLVLCTGCLLYIVDQFTHLSRLFMCFLILLSLYIVVFIMPLTDQFGNLTEPRFFEILGLIPALHILLMIRDRRSISIASFFVVLCQSLLLIFVYYCRSTSAWQLMLILLMPVCVWLRLKSRRAPGYESKRSLSLRLMRTCWPALLPLVGLMVLPAYKNLVCNPIVLQNGSAHLFWHNAFMGLCLQPDLARVYQVDIDDQSVENAAERYLLDHSRITERDEMFAEGCNAPSFNRIKYDSVVRELYWDACATHVKEAISSFLVYRPLLFFKHVSWAIGTRPADVDDLHLHDHVLATAERRTSQQLFLNPLRCDALFLLSLAMLCVCPVSNASWRRNAACLLSVAVFSLLPAVVVYPLLHHLGVVFVCWIASLYMIAAWLIVAVGKRCLTAGEGIAMQ